MKYFLDTEFIEGFTKPTIGRRRHFIDLISIGIEAEDGRTYYAINSEYKYKDADEWVKKNVIQPIYINEIHGDMRNTYDATNFHHYVGKPVAEIAKEIVAFINPEIDELIYTYTRHDAWMEQYYPKEFDYIRKHNTKIPDHYYTSGNDGYVKNRALIYNQPEFYGYYSDYDWVLFCSMFGRMIDLPKGFPMYCRDLKQMLDEAVLLKMSDAEWWRKNQYSAVPKDFEEALSMIKAHHVYPKQKQEHNALQDAKWNKALFLLLMLMNK